MSERWSQVVALFHGARALGPDERAGWLVEMTDDAGLRQEVLELCRADGASHPVLDAAAARLAALATEVGGPLAPGARVGPFEVIDVLAAGASGTVHRARQEQPARTVALKVLDAGLGDPERLRRFEHEAELLARLDHPHVAHVYQAGTMERGERRVPWIAMELVEGARTLTGFAREQDLDLRARVELVLAACEAVQHGHRKGVVHRDLKPDNLLVGGDGQLKVIDFGVAKSTDGDALVTRAGELIGTLAYMSPEQASGREVDTASDVYALGVVLHELLTGRRPHDLEGLDLVGAARRIATEPADPALCAGLPVDLRWVVGRALAPDPGARYGSVGALAEDLTRWAEGHPVLARPPSAAYHLARWARRNPALVMMTLSLVFALLVGSGLAVWGMLQARRGQADAEWGQRYLSELLLEGDPYVTGENLLFSEAVLRSLEHLDREPPPAGIERDLRWRLGSLVRHLGRPREAVRELELAHELATRELGPDHRTTLEVGVELGRLLTKLGRFDEAEALLRATRERSLRLAGGEDRLSLSAADAVNQLLLQREEVGAALNKHREVLALRIELLGHDDEDTQSSRNNLATVLQRLNRYEEARVLHQEVLVARQRSLGDDNPLTVIARGNLAASLQNLGERQGAEEHLRAGLVSAERVLPQYHDVTSNLRNNLGVLLRTTGRRGGALGLFELALEGRRRRLGLDHETTLTTLANLIALHVAVATDPESEGEQARLATSEAERLFGEYTRNEHVLADRKEPQLASLRANYARLLLSQGRKEAALAMATEAVHLAPQVWTEDAWQVGVVRSGRADVLLALGRTAEAAEEYEASLRLLDHLPEDNTYRSRVEVSLAGLGR